MSRIIGIRHRVKRTADGEARPTQVAMLEHGEIWGVLELPDETAERDFVLGVFPTKFRSLEDGDKITDFPVHQIKWRELKEGETADFFKPEFLKKEGKKWFTVEKVPVKESYEGLRGGDTVAMVLGGSGDMLAYALSNRAQNIGAKILRLPSFVLSKRRGDGKKDDDSVVLAKLAETETSLFYKIRPRDRETILVRETLRQRIDAMKARIGCEQRLYQRAIGQMFLKSNMTPEGAVEKAFDELKASDVILQNLLAEEKRSESELYTATEALDVYREVFATIEGVGPKIASRLIAAIIDIRRFETEAKLKAFCGVHVLPDGSFPRRSRGKVSNWNPDARQALFLFADQMNRRPDSVWGTKLLEYKAKMREKYPEVLVVEVSDKESTTGTRKVKKYTKGHLHKMACWKTLNKFVEWLWKEWWKLEGRKFPTPSGPAPTSEVVPVEVG